MEKAAASRQNRLQCPPRVNELDKLLELVYLAVTRLRVLLGETGFQDLTSSSSRPISEKGRFAYNYVEPMFQWWGANTRILTTQCLGCVDVANSSGAVVTVVNGASHNYAGFYKMTPESEELQRLCLESLPVSNSDALPLLRDAVHKAIADFLHADWVGTTSTGYGSNYVALPALMSDGEELIILMDKDCHNSMFTGVFIGQKHELRKFAHNDMRELETFLQRIEDKGGFLHRVLVVVEGLYSMEGDVPPLADLHRLKERYGFILYCDEAHSFLSLGKTGRGCLEYWNDNHPEAALPCDLIDIRTATLSKAIGGIGGVIAAKHRFAGCFQRYMGQIEDRDNISIPTSTMVQALWVLEQPSRTAFNLHRLSVISRFCRAELARLGIFVYGDEGTPVLPVWAGRPSVSAKLSFELRRAGLLASPVTTPAVPWWESRVRINLSADFTDDNVNQLIHAIVSAAIKIGICKKYDMRTPRRHFKIDGVNGIERLLLRDAGDPRESSKAFSRIQALLQKQSVMWSKHPSSSSMKQYRSLSILEAGHASRAFYGVGAGSARWISGTFPPHLAAEALVARVTGTETAMIYPDATIGIASTMPALARPLLGFKDRHHYMLFPQASALPRPVLDGLSLALPARTKTTARSKLVTYNDPAHLISQVQQLSSESTAAVCFTIYLHADEKHVMEKLLDIIESSSSSKKKRAITILLHSPHRMLDMRLDLVMDAHRRVLGRNVHVLVYGSLSGTFGLPGGYLAGPETLIRELRYTSRGYMFTTSTPPFVMDMLRVALEENSDSDDS